MKFDNIWFINKATEIHGDKYDYSLVNYINLRTKVKIICPNHGEFEQSPDKHFRKRGCQKCGGTTKLTTNEFIIKAKNIHGDKYDYSLVDYSNSHNKVKIICPKHHISNRGCPFCRESLGEREIAKFLTESNIEYIRQKKFKDCVNKSSLIFDFFLPNKNMCIEYDGIQHFIPIKYFGGEDKLKMTKKNDNIKNNYCNINNIKILRIKYNEDIVYKLKNNII